MKKLIVLMIAMVSILSCTKENEEPNENIWQAFGVYVKTGAGTTDFQIHIDNGDLVIPVEIPGDISASADTARVIVTYTVLTEDSLSDGSKKLNSKIHEVFEVLTKDIINLTEENSDSLGNDPVGINANNVWIARNYLNIMFSFYGNDQVHTFNVIKYPNDSLTTDGRLLMEFRHNANDDYPGIKYNGVVSYDLNSLPQASNDSIPIMVKFIDYDGKILEWKDTFYGDELKSTFQDIGFDNRNYWVE